MSQKADIRGTENEADAEYEAGKENITVAYTHYKKLDYTTAYIAFSSLYL